MCNTTTKSTTTSEQRATPTAEETELNKRNLRIALATEQPETQAQLSGLNLVNQLLTGQGNLPGFFQGMAKGISPEAIGQQAYSYAQRSLPQFQGQGILDSGIMGKQISRGIANEILFPAEQFNIGAMQNMLNLALSGQAQVQAPIQANVNNLSATLAGLRPVSGTSTLTTNPFQQAFYSAAGTSLAKTFTGGRSFQYGNVGIGGT